MAKRNKRYKKTNLEQLKKDIRYKRNVEIANEEVPAASITIIKRNGNKEPLDYKKLTRVAMWATNDSKELTEELLRDTEIKLHNEIKVQDMYKSLIHTAVSKISMLYPDWEYVAAKLVLLEMYKESWGIVDKSYPDIKDVIEHGVKFKVYDSETISKYSDNDLKKINAMIKKDRDYLFNYKGLVTFYDKYCLNYSKTKKLELPQITYMRIAMALMVDESDRLTKIKNMYDALSQHHYTVATPIALNALTPSQQLSSCVLNTVADDSHSILGTNENLGIYSKHKGGTALNISNLRAKGSFIQGGGFSSGPVPFLKVIEATMKAWNQGGKRPGACAIYFSWWTLDAFDLLSLKSNGGTDENRARGLKYGFKMNQLFIDRVINDENISLFDPKDVPELVGKFGKEFEYKYKKYESMSVRRKTIPARDLWEKMLKERTETGNIYLFHEENVNESSMLNRYIGSSNLCAEIVLPSRPSKLLNEELYTMEDGDKRIVKRYTAGEIALCNLSSINLERWFYMDNEEKAKLTETIVRALDNTVDLAHYPVKEGKNSNLMYRYLGIGVLNLVNYLALNEISIDTQEALEEQDKLFDEISYLLIKASVKLAKEKGRFQNFYETAWAKGDLPIFRANKEAEELTEYTFDMDKWDTLRKEIVKYGLRNAQLMAIAPTATSGKAINAIESIEPIHDFFYKEEGTITLPTIVPNFKKNNRFYKKNFECDQDMLLKGAAVRQKWLDQSQSVNVYVKTPDSLLELTKLHLKAFKLGLKTLYYFKQQKETSEEVCESCT
jgi:ribonucleoside-diphosphate reductase alpha chain